MPVGCRMGGSTGIHAKNKTTMKKKHAYEVIIIGGSYAGLAAAMALGRAMRSVAVIDNGKPCNAATPYAHNFLTNDGRTPGQVTAVAREQVLKYPTIRMVSDQATAVMKTPAGFVLSTAKQESYTASKLVFATGIQDIMLPIPGFAQCWGKSVIHCPYCHGYEVRNQATGILANGDTAFELAMLVSHWTPDLVIYTNGKSTIAETARLKKHNILIVETGIESLEHTNGLLHAIRFKDGSLVQVHALYTRPGFRQHCLIPETLGCLITKSGYLSTDITQKTSVPGVFACGDNTSPIRTISNAVAQGALAGMMVNKELIQESFQPY